MKKNLKGMTLIEVLVAVIITGIVLSALLTGLNFASKCNMHNANVTMALNFAQGLMEQVGNLRYADLDSYNGYTDTVLLYQSEDVDVVADRSVEVIDVTLGSVTYKTVKVTVSWDWQGKSYIEEVNTLRSDY